MFRFSRSGLFPNSRRRCRRRSGALVGESLESRTLLSTFYVNGDTGNDQNDGSADAPFRSIQRGVRMAGATPGNDEVVIEPTQQPYSGPVYISSVNEELRTDGDNDVVIRGATGVAGDVRIESFTTKFTNEAGFDVTISDLTLSGGGHGILNAGSGTTTIDNVDISNNTGSGVLALNGDTMVRDSNITDSWQGIWAGFDTNRGTTPNNVTVEDTTLNANRNFGIITRQMTGGVSLTNVTADSNPRAGGNFNSYTNVTINGGSFSNNNFNGIFFHPGSDVTLTDVDIDGNGRNGVFFDKVANIAITGGSVDDNGYSGINSYQTDGLSVSGTSISRNGQAVATTSGVDGSGVRVFPASAAPISFTSVFVSGNFGRSGAAGIDIEAADSFNEQFFTNVLIEDSTISDHKTLNGDWGGGLRFLGAIHAEINGSQIQNNDARFGGGLRFLGRNFNGVASSLSMSGTIVDGNTSDFGGGLSLENQVTANISGSTFTNNSSLRHGGGISYVVRAVPEGGKLTISDSEIAHNSARTQTGGGVYSFSADINNTVVTNSTISNNSAGSNGGGLSVIGRSFVESPALVVEGSSVDGNSALEGGGGLHVISNQPVHLSSSLFASNTATGRGGAYAGGIRLNASGGTFENVTVSGNSAENGTGGIVLQSGNFYQLTNVTVTENTGLNVGGLFSIVQQNTHLTNTVVAGNTRLQADDPQFPFTTTDLGGAATSGGGNIIGITVPSLLVNTQSTDKVGTVGTPIDAKLGPLQDNGGPTLTHLPAIDSPAVDGGVFAASVLSADQRGEPRPARQTFDSGAVEVQNSAPTIAADANVVEVSEGQIAAIAGTAIDPDGDALILTASIGTVELNSDGTWNWTYDTDDGPGGSDSVMISATDAFGDSTSVQFALTVINVAPEAGISGPADAIPGQATEFILSASDLSTADETAGFQFRIDWDNDGTVDQIVTGGTSTSVNHTFGATGSQTISVVAVDKDGGISDAVTTTVNVIQPVELTASKNSINLNSTGGFISLTLWSTPAFNAATVDVGTVIWAGASVSRSKLRDLNGDGLDDLELKFRLSDTNLVRLYKEAVRTDRNTTRKTLSIGLTGRTTSGLDLFGEMELDLFMTGKKLRDLLNSL